MNFPPKHKINRIRKKKKKPANIYTPTTIPFWADISITEPTPRETPKISPQTQDNEVELTDDNLPAVPLADGNKEGHGIQIKIKPQLYMQGKPQEKIKLNTIQSEKSVTQESDLNKSVSEAEGKQKQAAKEPVQTSVVAQDLENAKSVPVLDVIGTTTTNKTDPNQGLKMAETKKTSQIPVSWNEWVHNEKAGLQAKKIPILSSQGANKELKKTAQHGNKPIPQVHTIPTSNYQGATKRVPYQPMRPLMSHQNVYNVEDPSNPIGGYILRPRGIPYTFLMQQQKLGAIEPQQSFTPTNAATMNVTPKQPMYIQQPIRNLNSFRDPNYTASGAPFIQTDNFEMPPLQATPSQAYSPSDLYVEGNDDGNNTNTNEEARESSSSPDIWQPGERRLSAFKRLGPLSQPKKPKLTINLSFDKEQPVREVLGEKGSGGTPSLWVPVHQRPDVRGSADETVARFLPLWPWRAGVAVRRAVTARPSKTAMMMEQEQMEEIYDKENLFIQVSVKGYPHTWKKEDVLDALLESVKGKSFIPCFTEFSPQECKFLVLRARAALAGIHRLGFSVRCGAAELALSIARVELSLRQLDFEPQLVLARRVSMGYDSERKLSLRAFTLQNDLSHFIYFPLSRVSNQTELVELPSAVDWKFLTDLDLSHNRITTLIGFDLRQTTPRLQSLDVSHNCMERATALLQCRGLALAALQLEGNPLCADFTDPQRYVAVLRMMFPMLREIDGLPIVLKGDLPPINKHYCPSEVWDVVEKFLQIYFPILDSPPEDRVLLEEMYSEEAILTVTYRPSLTHSSVYKRFPNLFLNSRNLFESEREIVKSSKNIVRLMRKWPGLEHDPTTFNVDVMWYTESSILVRMSGVAKLTSDRLAVDEPLLSCARAVLLHAPAGPRYRVRHEMLCWDRADGELAGNAFRLTAVPKKKFNISLEITPDKYMKEQLRNIFMKLTDLDKEPSERCLEEKEWNLKNALEYFVKLLKLNRIDLLYESSAS